MGQRFIPSRIDARALTGYDPGVLGVEKSAPTLNGGQFPFRVPRLRTPGLAYMAGLAARGMSQWFDEAFLPPPVIPRTTTANPNRTVRGVYGAGTISASANYIPSVCVPQVVR